MFNSVRAHRLSDGIVEQIENAAGAGQLKPGDKLPTERELAALFRVSRTCVREAIRALELRGLLEVRRGVKGGQFIRSADSRALATGLLMLFRSHPMVPADFAEARVMIEPEVARIAAIRATNADLQELGSIVDSRARLAARSEEAQTLDIAFHRLVAQATKNSVQILVVNMLMDLEANVIRSRLLLGDDEAMKIATAHRRILSALAARDANAGAMRMRAHLVELQRCLARAAAQGPGPAKIVPGPEVSRLTGASSSRGSVAS